MNKKNLISGFFIGIFVSLIVFFISNFFYIFQIFELKILDLKFNLRGKEKPNLPILIIGIDEKSLQKLGRWPWPRNYHAKIINYIDRGCPKQIFLDIFFVEKSRENPENDILLEKAIKNSKRVYLDYFFEKEKIEVDKFSEEVVKKFSFELPKNYKSKQTVKSLIPPIYKLANSVKGLGHSIVFEDEDDVIRHTPLLVEYSKKFYPSISLVLAMDLLGIERKEISINPEKYLKIQNLHIPFDRENLMLINYRGPAKTFEYISYIDVFEKRIPFYFFKDKIVMIGATASGIYDIRPTPYGIMPGIEIIANSLDTIVNKRFLRKTEKNINFLIYLFLGIIASFFVLNLKPLKTFIFIFFLTAVFIFSNFYIFEKYLILFPFISPLIVLFLSIFSSLSYRYLTEEKEKKKIKYAFQHYVSHTVVNEILKDFSKLKLGGEKKVLTVLFSDIRGFTNFSEKYPPEEVVSYLNEYFTEMTEIIFEENGTLDKFIGDAIMVIYGAPVYFPDHAERAVRTAIKMQKKIKELQNYWKEPLRVGIGINTGEMVVGNMGSKNRWDYTVIGDSVNLASRLEGLTKEYKVDIIISEYTYQEIKNKVDVRYLGKVKVKGKEKEVGIYEVLGLK
jgi:adenylate cyclase